MRDILFRGFHRDENGTEKAFVNGKLVKGTWVYGDLISIPNKNYYAIMPQTAASYTIQVIHATVCQYIGLKDKNGKKIFDGDIIKNWFDEIGSLKYEQKRAAFVVNNLKNVYILWTNKDIEVIGNIFENPELLEENKCKA